MRFQSKKDLWLGILLWGIFAMALFFTLSSEISVATLLPVALFIGIVSWFWFGTYYTFIGDNRLLIRCGPVRGTVYIDKIKSVKSSRSIWASASLSLDRLKISTAQGFWNSVWYISPKDKQGFIAELKKRNPNIHITL